MIEITDNLFIDERELHFDFIRASGPGGQNVNKVSTAVQLRFDVAHSQSLPEDVRQRLIKLAGKKVTDDGILIIEARRHRSQRQNREDAVQRLIALVRQAMVKPKPRKRKGPSQAMKRRRLEAKRRRSEIKRLRQPVREF